MVEKSSDEGEKRKKKSPKKKSPVKVERKILSLNQVQIGEYVSQPNIVDPRNVGKRSTIRIDERSPSQSPEQSPKPAKLTQLKAKRGSFNKTMNMTSRLKSPTFKS